MTRSTQSVRVFAPNSHTGLDCIQTSGAAS